MALLPALVASVSTLTSSGTFTDTQTVTIAGKVYTSQTTLTDVDGNFLIGANQTASHLNLMNAINLGSGAGTTYATAMTIHPLVKATAATGTTTVIAAKLKGTVGNEFRTTETQTNASWTSTVMASGTGNFKEALDDIQDSMQCNAEVLAALQNCLSFVDAD